MSEEIDPQKLMELDYDDAVDDYGEDVVNMTYDLFVNKLYHDLKDKIPKAFKDNSYTDLKIIFHNFKTTSRYLGAENFSELCNDIQICCKEGTENIPKLQSLYPIVMANFDKFYQICKKQYHKIIGTESESNEEEKEEDSSIVITEINDIVSEGDLENTTDIRSKLLFEEDKENTFKSSIENSEESFSKNLHEIDVHDRTRSDRNLISISLEKEIKLTNSYPILCLRNQPSVIDNAVYKYVKNMNIDNNVLVKLKNYIQTKELNKIIEIINQIKEYLKLILTENFKIYLGQVVGEIEKGGKFLNEKELIAKFEKLNKEMNDIFEKHCKKSNEFETKTSPKRLLQSKKELDLKNLENLSKTNLICVVSERQSNGSFSSPKVLNSSLNFSEAIKDINSLDNSVRVAFANKNFRQLIEGLKGLKEFTSKNNLLIVESKIEKVLTKLKTYDTFEECEKGYQNLKDELKSIKNEIDDLLLKSPLTSSDFPEEETKTILSDLKPGNYQWFFTLNLEDSPESEEETEEKKNINILKYRKNSKKNTKQEFDEEDIFNCPFKDNFNCYML